MFNSTAERENKDKFILSEKISLETASASLFERASSITLQGDLACLQKTGFDVSSWNTENPRFDSAPDITTEENFIQNAKRDLIRQPNNPYLLNNLGKTLLSSGKIAEAITLFEQTLTIKPNFTIAALNLASAYELKGEDNVAIQIYSDTLVHHPKDMRPLINIANIHLRNKRVSEAKEIFEKILRDDPDNIAALDKLSTIYLLEGKPEYSIRFLKKCRLLNANLPVVYNNLGVAYAAKESYANAIEAFKISLKLLPYYENAVLNLATALEKISEVDTAIDLLEKFLENHKSYQVQELLAKLFIKINKPQKSLNFLRILLNKSRTIQSNSEETGRLLNNIGVVYHKIQDFESAEKAYLESVSERGYTHPTLLANLIDLNFDLNKLDRVKYFLNILKDKFPNDKLYYYFKGKFLYKNGDIQGALAELNFSVEKFDSLLPSYQLLGYIYAEHRNFNKAIEVSEKAIMKWPNNKATINNLAYYLLMNNQIERARLLLKKVENCKDAGVYLNATRGLLKIKEGYIEEGASLYNFAKDLTGDIELQRLVQQKKNLELGRYFLEKRELLKAKDYLDKVFVMKTKENIFIQEAKELYRNL